MMCPQQSLRQVSKRSRSTSQKKCLLLMATRTLSFLSPLISMRGTIWSIHFQRGKGIDDDEMSTVSGSEEEPMPADGISVVSGEEEPTAPTEPELAVPELRDTSAVIRDAFRRMDDVDVEDIFRKRGFVMKSIPFCLRGPYRVAL